MALQSILQPCLLWWLPLECASEHLLPAASSARLVLHVLDGNPVVTAFLSAKEKLFLSAKEMLIKANFDLINKAVNLFQGCSVWWNWVLSLSSTSSPLQHTW